MKFSVVSFQLSVKARNIEGRASPTPTICRGIASRPLVVGTGERPQSATGGQRELTTEN
jgi:hypothetical protein